MTILATDPTSTITQLERDQTENAKYWNTCTCTCTVLSVISAGCNYGSDTTCLFPCRCVATCHRIRGCIDEGYTCGSLNYHEDLDANDGKTFSGPQCQIGEFCQHNFLNTTAGLQHATYSLSWLCISLITWSIHACVYATGNVGYGKTARQTADYGGRTADLALDGIGYDTYRRHCIYTAEVPGTIAFWTVDLGTRHQILNITIYKRHGKFKLEIAMTTIIGGNFVMIGQILVYDKFLAAYYSAV